MTPYDVLRLCLVLENLREMRGKKIGRKNRRKKSEKINKK